MLTPSFVFFEFLHSSERFSYLVVSRGIICQGLCDESRQSMGNCFRYIRRKRCAKFIDNSAIIRERIGGCASMTTEFELAMNGSSKNLLDSIAVLADKGINLDTIVTGREGGHYTLNFITGSEEGVRR